MEDNEEHTNLDNILKDGIDKHGWFVIKVDGSEYQPSFAYTIGLWKNYNHPEIISFGLTTETLHLILNDAGEMAKSGQEINTTDPYDDFFESGSAAFIKIDERNLSDYFGAAIRYYGHKNFPAIQLIWTDRNNKFPWEGDYEDEFEYKQPLLDRNGDFKFREVENLAIFTTRQFLENDKPIIRVIHENDGDWQFLTGDQLLEDARIVSLKQMVLKDETLNDVFNLEYGQQAEREAIGEKWVRRKIVTEDESE